MDSSLAFGGRVVLGNAGSFGSLTAVDARLRYAWLVVVTGIMMSSAAGYCASAAGLFPHL